MIKSNAENIKNGLKKALEFAAKTWQTNVHVIANELIETSVSQEESANHHNITGNMITSIVAAEYVAGAVIGKDDYRSKPAVRGMLTRGEVFEGITWDGTMVKYRGSVDTSGKTAAEENIAKVQEIKPRLRNSLIMLRGTPYTLQDFNLNMMTDLMVYAKGMIKIRPIVK